MGCAQQLGVAAARDGARRPGVTAAPFIRSGTAAAIDLARRAGRLGYGSFWVAEVSGIEAAAITLPAPAVYEARPALPLH